MFLPVLSPRPLSPADNTGPLRLRLVGEAQAQYTCQCARPCQAIRRPTLDHNMVYVAPYTGVAPPNRPPPTGVPIGPGGWPSPYTPRSTQRPNTLLELFFCFCKNNKKASSSAEVTGGGNGGRIPTALARAWAHGTGQWDWSFSPMRVHRWGTVCTPVMGGECNLGTSTRELISDNCCKKAKR